MLSLYDIKHIALCMSHRYAGACRSVYKKYARCKEYMASLSGEIISSNWNEGGGSWELTTIRAESKEVFIINKCVHTCRAMV